MGIKTYLLEKITIIKDNLYQVMKYYNSQEVIKLTNISERLFKERIKNIKDKYEKDLLYKKRGRWKIHQKVVDAGEFNRIRNPKTNDNIMKWVDIIKTIKWDFFITITPGPSTINDNKELLKYVSKLLKKKYRGKELLLFGTIEETPNTKGTRIISYYFLFDYHLQQLEIPLLSNQTTIENLKQLDRLQEQFNLSLHQSKIIIENVSVKDINKILYQIKTQDLDNKINNLGGYTLSIFKNKYNLNF